MCYDTNEEAMMRRYCFHANELLRNAEERRWVASTHTCQHAVNTTSTTAHHCIHYTYPFIIIYIYVCISFSTEQHTRTTLLRVDPPRGWACVWASPQGASAEPCTPPSWYVCGGRVPGVDAARRVPPRPSRS